jgi:hypothetical protein
LSWHGSTFFPVIESVWFNNEPPETPEAAAVELERAGHVAVAGYVRSMNHEAYEDMLWNSHLWKIELDRPS